MTNIALKKIALGLMAAVLCAGTGASAQDYRGDRDDRYERSDRYDRNDDSRYDDRSHRRYDGRYERRNDDFLPREFMRGRYVFNGWRERGLKKPGPGQEWVRVCDTFILASVRNGRIEEAHMAGRGRVDDKPTWRLANSLRCRR